MKAFTKYDFASAPQESLSGLNSAQATFGHIPNLVKYMAQSPQTLNSYLAIWQQVEQFSLDVTERQIVMMTVNRFHECRYCMAGHSVMANKEGIDPLVISALRDDQPLKDARSRVGIQPAPQGAVHGSGHLLLRRGRRR